MIAPTLTARQSEALRLLCAGADAHEIARRMVTAEGTTAAHIAACRAKLGAVSRVHLVALALASGIVAPADVLPDLLSRRAPL